MLIDTFMDHLPLKTYLRTYRKKSGLSQEDLAYLMGWVTATGISRHENGRRLPTLAVALHYEIILGESVSNIYQGLSRSAETLILRRAEGLLAKLRKAPRSPRNLQRIKHLEGIIKRSREFNHQDHA